MTKTADSFRNIGELIDRVEQIREELLAAQNSLEKIEPVETKLSEDDGKK
jgi:hypothetical protein